MTFAWPWMLTLLAVVPSLLLGYRALLARQTARRAQLAELGLVAPSPGRRRHVPPALFLVALVVLLIGLARPEATVAQPRREGTVVLAFDVSSSMTADDVAPDRLTAAKVAAKAFVDRQPEQVRIGVVAFGQAGVVVQQPTSQRPPVLAAIDRLTPQGGTTLGRGIQTALGAIAERTIQLDDAPRTDTAPGPDIGYYSSAAVVLLTDGDNTDGPAPSAAADLAAQAGVKVFPIGVGTAAGSVVRVDGFQVATALDEALLRGIADTTDGEYVAAGDTEAMDRVLGALDLAWTTRAERTEITAMFAAAAALLLMVGAGLSFAWFGRVI